MSFAWLKRYMPRSLYGRAALILVLPVVTLQLVVSLVFIQRHFEGVTEQMTRNLVLELGYVLSEVNAAPDAAVAAQVAAERAVPLGLQFEIGADAPQGDIRAVYDLSGRVVIDTLRAGLPALGAVDLGVDRRVIAALDTAHGTARVSFDRRRVSASNPHQLLVLIVVLGVLMTLISFLFLRNQLRPIKRLATASEAFGRGRMERYRPSGAIEVRAAGNAFLDMRNRIERQIEQRTMMLSGISHDLRTPLTRLKLGLEMLEGEDVADLKRDVDDMEQLVATFMSFARDMAEEEPEPTDPTALARAVAEDARRAGHEVGLRGDDAAAIRVPLRPMAIRRALDNLIANGARHGTRVELSVDLLDSALRFAVEDDGPGIAPERREEALAPFARLDPARNQNRGGGVGLGLSIAHDVARAHGGTLRLGESARLGGLKAEIVLPR